LSATLVYLSGALGDLLLSTPALAAIRHVCAGTALQFVAPRALAQLYPQLADTFIDIDSAHAAALFGPDAAAMLHAAQIATAIVFAPPASALVRNLCQIPQLTVHAIDVTPRLCVAQHYSQFVHDRLCAALGCALPFGIPQPCATAPSSPAAQPFAVVHPGSGAPRKTAAPTLLAAACHDLQGKQDWQWLLVGGEADAQAVRAFRAEFSRPVAVVTNPTLPELAWYLNHAQAYVGNDSGVSHLAGIVGARGTVFFGPTDPQVWRPLGTTLAVRRF